MKGLDKDGDTAWLREARGKAVKIISFLLTYLPETYDYQVIFMHRDLDEVLASQNKMLDAARRGRPDGQLEQRRTMLALYRQHLDKVMRFLANRAASGLLTVNYGDAMAQPAVEARRINDFLGGTLDVDRMSAVSDPALYRNRRARARRRQKLLRCQRRSDTQGRPMTPSPLLSRNIWPWAVAKAQVGAGGRHPTLAVFCP